mgnify:CR=1 FL=1
MNQHANAAPAPCAPIGLFACRNGDVIDIPLGLSGLQVFVVLHLLRVGFGYEDGDAFVGARTYVEDAGYDELSKRFRLRVHAECVWKTALGTRTTNNEFVQVLLFRRADFAESTDDLTRLTDGERPASSGARRA